MQQMPMYQVTIKGRTLDELKNAVSDIHQELGSGTVVNGMDKDLSDGFEIVDHIPMGDDVKEVTPAIQQVGRAEHIINPPTLPSGHSLDSELDVEGIPWDSRIHGGGKTKVKAGTWKKKKGLDINIYNQIKQELLMKVQQDVTPAPIPTAPITTSTPVASIPTVVTPAPIVEQPVVTPSPVATPAPVSIPPMSTGGHSVETFSANFPMILGSLISEGKLTPEYVNTLKEYFKVAEIWNVSEDQKKEMFESFAGFGFIQKVG